MIEEVVDAINAFAGIARELNVEQKTIKLINQQLNNVYLENKGSSIRV